MIADVLTILWKEWREIRSSPRTGGTRGGWLNLLLVVGVFGVLLPWQTGPAWIESPAVLLYWGWVPLFLVSSVVADSFAGERERATLETLLASRLSDQAILLGKIGAAVAYGWGLTAISLLLGLVTVNVAYSAGKDGLLLYSPLQWWGGLGLSLLASGLAATAGVLVSLRAGSVRQAAQTMSLAIVAVFLVPLFGARLLPPEWQARIAGAVAGASVAALVSAAIALLAVLDVLLYAAARARFQRHKLILD